MTEYEFWHESDDSPDYFGPLIGDPAVWPVVRIPLADLTFFEPLPAAHIHELFATAHTGLNHGQRNVVKNAVR